jgi:hypothetical protein
MKVIDLVKSEGPILVLSYDPSTKLFYLTDEYHKELVKLTRAALTLFLQGDIVIHDSKGREWDFPKVPADMRIRSEKLMDFLGMY